MGNRNWGRILAISLACVAVGAPLAGEAGQGRGRARGLEGSPGLQRGPQDINARGRANTSRLFKDPASTRGYESGFDLGLADGRDGQRYDPVRHRDYRDADRGYASAYGSRDGYKSNFRTGFRQGYEDGYRDGTRTGK